MAEAARGSAPPAAPKLDGVALLFFLAAIVAAAAVVFQGAVRSYPDWPNTSDDMFYYLVLARETAAHGLVSVDGLRPTNGFHPLWFLILTWITPLLAPAALPGAALAILGTFHLGASLVLWRTLRRLAGPNLAALLAGLYAANPFVIRVVFAGVESAIAAFFVGLCLLWHVRWLERGRSADRALSLVALGLAVASRTDSVMLAAALSGAAALGRLRETRSPGLALRAVDWAPVTVAALPVLAFGVWSLIATGEFLQTSGRSLSFWQSVGDWRLIREAVKGLGALAGPAAVVVYALEVAVQFVGWITRAPIELLVRHPLGVALLGGAIAARVVLGMRGPGLSPRRLERDSATPAPALAGPARRRLAAEILTFFVLIWSFYALLFRHCQIWYWHTSVYAVALPAALWLAPIRRIGPGVMAFTASLRIPRGVLPLLLLLAVPLLVGVLDPLAPRARPAASPAAPTADPLARVPEGARLGAFDTGQLGWEHPRLEVVNLDGLVNNAAYRALRARRIGRYMLDERIEWLYVRDGVVARFRAFGLQAWLEAADPVGRSGDGVVLYRLRPADARR